MGIPANTIRNGIIEEIVSKNNNTFITVSQPGRNCKSCPCFGERIQLIVSRSTIILDENGTPIPVGSLRISMTINASYSSIMTRSIPPQSVAYIIQIIKRVRPDANMATHRCTNRY